MKKVFLTTAVMGLITLTSCSKEKDCKCTAKEQEGVVFEGPTEFSFTTEEDNCTKGLIEYSINELGESPDEIPSESEVRQFWDCQEE